MKRLGSRARRWIAALLVLVLVGVMGWYKLLREEPLPYVSDVDYFKYGSVGVEASSGLPFAVWSVLPEVFGDLIDRGGAMPPSASSRSRVTTSRSGCRSRRLDFRASA